MSHPTPHIHCSLLKALFCDLCNVQRPSRSLPFLPAPLASRAAKVSPLHDCTPSRHQCCGENFMIAGVIDSIYGLRLVGLDICAGHRFH